MNEFKDVLNKYLLYFCVLRSVNGTSLCHSSERA